MEDSSDFFTSPSFQEEGKTLELEPLFSSEHGYSELYRGDRDGRFRVFKALKKAYRGNPIYERLLRKEFEIGYSLSHNNICEFYSFTSLPDIGNCIEMEWVDGCSLENMMKTGSIDKALAHKIIEQLCDALGYMHSKQVIHRDLKPSNILITYNGKNVKLIDFGLSDTDAHSVLKAPAGTQYYCAPELLHNGPVDYRSDIYSLGVVIKDIAPSFGKVIRKCCKEDPSQRFQSMEEVKEAINHSSKWRIVLFAIILAVALSFAAYYLLRETPEIPSAEEITPAESIQEAEPTPAVTPEPETSTEVASPDKAQKSSVKKTKETKTTEEKVEQPKNSEPEKDKEATITALDEIFRQATDMFE